MSTDSDPDLSVNDRVFVIPIEERDESDYEEEIDYRPPPYDLVYPPPSYTESGMKRNISSGQETLNTSDEASHGSVEVPPPPYAPPLDVVSQTDNHQQEPHHS